MTGGLISGSGNLVGGWTRSVMPAGSVFIVGQASLLNTLVLLDRYRRFPIALYGASDC